MGTLADRVRRTTPLLAWRGRQQHVSDAPEWFEGVVEALREGRNGSAACEEVGRRAAQDGTELVTVLDGLRAAVRAATGGEPSYTAVRALSNAWAEETLSWVHQLSCEDPLTGLARPAHLRARLAELYRAAAGGGGAPAHALVVVDVPRTTTTSVLDGGLAVLHTAERVRAVFAGEETVCRVSDSRLLVLTARTARLPHRAAALGELLGGSRRRVRVWVEGLPAVPASADALLDELMRTGRAADRPGG